jgi:hypothetical protein
MVAGLGGAEELGEIIEGPGSRDDGGWQWLAHWFGQRVLAKRRRELAVLPAGALPRVRPLRLAIDDRQYDIFVPDRTILQIAASPRGRAIEAARRHCGGGHGEARSGTSPQRRGGDAAGVIRVHLRCSTNSWFRRVRQSGSRRAEASKSGGLKRCASAYGPPVRDVDPVRSVSPSGVRE